MKTTTNVIRLAFLTLAMVTYARASLAGYPVWYANCDSGCTGSVRYHQCTFYDPWDSWDTYAGCEDAWGDPYHTSCCGGYWGNDYDHEAYAYWNEECRMWGGGGPATFTNFSCNENYTRGSFYCSYVDPSCNE